MLGNLTVIRRKARTLVAVGLCLCVLGVGACKAKPQANGAGGTGGAAPSALAGGGGSLSAKEVHETRLRDVPSREQVERIVNPKNQPNYTGPTATIRGVVHATGDKAPESPVKDIEPNCQLAIPMFGRLFREGPARELADVLVTVTHYEGHLPSPEGSLKVYGVGCAWDRRTIGLTFGQYLEVIAKDRRPYVPELLGERTVAQLFALPDGDPIALVPTKTGRFVLHDSMRIFSRANVYVLAYPTHTVTGIDGGFEIRGIPIGKAKLGAILPETGRTAMRDVTLEAGQVLTVDLEIPFDKKAYELQMEKNSQDLRGATRATNAP
jgi:hypothetical protein